LQQCRSLSFWGKRAICSLNCTLQNSHKRTSRPVSRTLPLGAYPKESLSDVAKAFTFLARLIYQVCPAGKLVPNHGITGGGNAAENHGGAGDLHSSSGDLLEEGCSCRWYLIKTSQRSQVFGVSDNLLHWVSERFQQGTSLCLKAEQFR